LTTKVLPIANRFHKPVVFQLWFSSARGSSLQTYDSFSPQINDFLPADPSVPSDYDEQGRAYEAVLLALESTSWAQGTYPFGYSFFNFDSKGFSIRDKTAEQIVSQVYKQIKETPPSNAPVITSVATPGDYPSIAPNTWIEIKGTNLAPPSVGPNGMTWSTAPEFANGKRPTQLAGVSVTVNGNPAFMYYVSASQINVLTPAANMPDTVPIVVTIGQSSSVPFRVMAKEATPASLLVGGTHYILATHADNSLVGPSSMSVPEYPFSPARPGERIVLWTTGMGLPTEGVVNGASSQSGAPAVRPALRIGGVDATVDFAVGVTLAGLNGPGLYQVNITGPPRCS
jgi:uncharacterized protein (TIGR03437 family)